MQYVSVDVNGYGKKPNRLGRDLFMFQLTDKGELLPMGAKEQHTVSVQTHQQALLTVQDVHIKFCRIGNKNNVRGLS